MCQARTALGACALKDKIYAVGGQVCVCRGTLSFVLNSKLQGLLQLLDCASHAIPPNELPLAMGKHSAVSLRYAMPQDGKHVHTSVEEYDAGSDKWAILAAHLPCERKYHTACELHGKRPLLPFHTS